LQKVNTLFFKCHTYIGGTFFLNSLMAIASFPERRRGGEEERRRGSV
jgi:hypothetical protein